MALIQLQVNKRNAAPHLSRARHGESNQREGIYMGYRSQGDGEPAGCPECGGTGDVRSLIGDEEGADPCPSCGGMGYQLTRDEFANLEALQGDRDLRLAPEPEDTPSFANHGDEIAWHLARRTA